MRKKIIVANWKMFGRVSKLGPYLDALSAKVAGTQAEVVLCPPAVYLPEAKAQRSHDSVVQLGAQNAAAKQADGAFTGEQSAAMLAEYDCRYIIVGHSERRTYYGETSEDVAEKFLAVKAAGMTPIMCIGESAEQHQQGKAVEVITKQINDALAVAGADNFRDAVVAYEPIWAIGTGDTATPKQIEEIHGMIRQIFLSHGIDANTHMRVIYGGSVKPENAKEILLQPNVDGALVGGASLDAEAFAGIISAVNTN